MPLETAERNNNAINDRKHVHPQESNSSEGLYFKNQTPEFVPCQSPNKRTGSISIADRQMIQYLKSMLPRMPSKYMNMCSPRRRSLPHVLHSKMRLWHFGRNVPFSLIPEEAANKSNATWCTRDDKTRYSFWTQCSSCCCCCELEARPENSIVHPGNASDLPVATVIAIQMQTARRIQRLDSVHGSCPTRVDPPLPPPLQSRAHAGGKRRSSHHLCRKEAGKHYSVVSLTGENRVEVLPLLTTQADQRQERFHRQSVGDAMLSASPPPAVSTISDIPPIQFLNARPGIQQPKASGGGVSLAGRSTVTADISSSSNRLFYRPDMILNEQETSIRPSERSYSSTHASGSGDSIWGCGTQELIVASTKSNRGFENAIASEHRLPDRVVRQEAWNDCQRILSISSSSN